MTNKDSCFVIMPFGEPFDTYFTKVYKPAIDENKLLAVRGDSLFRSTQIMDDIWSAINNASVILAELTDRNPNVFYELGLAHARGKPAILVSSSIDDVPFDLRPLRVLIYNKNDPDWGTQLGKKISLALIETLANPLAATPHTFKTIVPADMPEESASSARITAIEESLNAIRLELDGPSVNGRLVDQSDKKLLPDLFVGDIVTHHVFGRGEVLEVEGAGTHRRIQVNFDTAGVKWLVQNYAGLRKENG